MDNRGQGAWPSIETLATETGLSSRATGTHLKKAVKDGWLHRKKWRAKGKDWAQYVYVAAFPTGIDCQELHSLPNSLGEESHVDSAEPGSTLVLNDVPTNSTENSTYDSTEPLADASEKQKCSAGREEFRQLVERLKGHVPENG